MKSIVLCGALICSLLAFARPNALLPHQIRRHGLTNENIDRIFAARENASVRLTKADWVAIKYELERYSCVTNWAWVCNNSNDFAQIYFRVDDANKTLTASNYVLRAELKHATDEVLAKRALEKTAKKFAKNLEKVRKDIGKYLDKSATGEEQEFWQLLLNLIPDPKGEER